MDGQNKSNQKRLKTNNFMNLQINMSEDSKIFQDGKYQVSDDFSPGKSKEKLGNTIQKVSNGQNGGMN